MARADKAFEVVPNAADMKRLKRFSERFPRQLPRVVSGAINLTARSAKTQAVREIAASAKVRQTSVRKRTIVRKATFREWVAAIIFTKRRLGLIEFKARQTKKGVSYDLGQSRKLIDHAFIQTLATGHRGVFIRKTKDGEMVPRLPIRELQGPSVKQVYQNTEQLSRRVMVEAQAKLHKNIQSKIDWILSRRAS